MPKIVVWLATAATLAPLSVRAQPTPPPAQPATPAGASAKTPNTVQGVTVNGDAGGLKTSIDRKSYDLTKDLATATGSMADALRNIPSVDVDLSGNVSLRGDANVTIMIDGKPSNQFKGPGAGAALQGLPADQFERVEVITNPSAAYSSEGTAGIINLITKKVRRAGASGTVRANLGGAGRRNGGANLTYNAEKLTLSADAGFRHDPQHSTSVEDRTAVDPQSGELLTSHRDFSLKGPLEQWNVRLAGDYDLDAKTRVSAEARHSDYNFDTTSTESFVTTDPSAAVVQDIRQAGVFRQDRDDTEGEVSLRHKFGDGHDLTASLSRERTADKDDERLSSLETLTPAAPTDFRDILQRDALMQTEAKADYTRPMPSDGKLKVGYDLRINDNLYDVETRLGTSLAEATLSPGESNLFHYRQTLNAAYATYEQPLGDLTVLAGLRLEDERLDLGQLTTGFALSRDDARLFPSLHLAYKLSEAQQLTASYSERIQRPNPEDLNPFRLVEEFTAEQGNPNLEPQITHSFEAGWQYKTAAATYLATLFYRLNEHGVTDVVTDLGEGVLLTTKENLTRSQNAGLELVASGKLSKALSYNASAELYENEIDASDLGPVLGVQARRSAFAAGGRAALTWQITPDDLIQVSGRITPKRLLPQGFIDPMVLVFLGYRHKFSEALSGVITVQDPFDIYRRVETLESPGLHEHVVDRGRIQAAYVGLTWSFGAAVKRPQSFDFGAQ